MRKLLGLFIVIASLTLCGCEVSPLGPTPTLLRPTATPTSQPPTATISPSPIPSPTKPPKVSGPLLIEGQQAQQLMGGPARGDVFYAYSPSGLYRTVDGGTSWQLVTGQLAEESFIVSPSHPEILYSGEGYPCYRGGPEVPMFKSTDGGTSRFELEGGTNLKPVVVHPDNPNMVYGIGCDGPYFTGDGGQIWEHQPSDIFLVYDVLKILPASRDWQIVYLGGASEGGAGALVKTADGGQTWQSVTGELSELWWISALAVDPADPDRIYFTEPHGFWRSEDGGATWQSSMAGLEDVVYHESGPLEQTYGLQAIAIDPLDSDKLYLGTIRGLYVSDDQGANWRKTRGEEWEDEEIEDLKAIDDEGTKLYITVARGVFTFYPGSK